MSIPSGPSRGRGNPETKRRLLHCCVVSVEQTCENGQWTHSKTLSKRIDAFDSVAIEVGVGYVENKGKAKEQMRMS